MSSLMRDWIGPVAEEELASASAWLKSGCQSQVYRTARFVYQAGILTVHLKKARDIQIIDFNGQRKYPFDVTVSDGTSHIRATFDRAACDLFVKTHQRKFTELTLGGVFGITDYELHFPSKRLTLHVLKFALKGSEGSATFGRPSAVEKRDDIQTTLAQVERVISSFGIGSTMDEQVSPICSQAGSFSERGSPTPSICTTQAGFSTQISNRINHHNVRTLGINDRPRSMGKNAELLALLNSKKNDPLRQPARQDDKRIGDEAGELLECATNISRKSAVLKPVSDERFVEMSSRLGGIANKQKINSAASSQALSNSCEPKDQVLLAKDPGLVSPVTSLLASHDSEKENSQSQEKTTIESLHIEDMHTERTNDPDDHGNTTSVDQYPDMDPFVGLSRVPRSYVRISKEQKALLEGNDSWVQPQASARQAQANIPVEAIKTLNFFIDQHSVLAGKQTVNGQEAELDTQPNGSENRISRPHQCGSEHDNSESVDDDQKRQNNDVGSERNNSGELCNQPNSENTEVSSISDGGQPTSLPGNGHERVQNSTCTVLTEGTQLDQGVHCEEDEGDDAGDDMSEVRSWSASPEAHLLPKSHRGLQNLELSTESAIEPLSPIGSIATSSDMDELPTTLGHGPATATQGSSSLPNIISQSPPFNNGIECVSIQLDRFPPLQVVPSSSPEEEDELDLVVPHAIDDEVEEGDVGAAADPHTTKRPPSSTLHDQLLVKVQHTPFPNTSGYEADGVGTTLKQRRRLFQTTKRQNDDISSDPVIPATFNDVSSQECAKFTDRVAPMTDLDGVERNPLSHNDVSEECENQKDSVSAQPFGTQLKNSQRSRNPFAYPCSVNNMSISHESSKTSSAIPENRDEVAESDHESTRARQRTNSPYQTSPPSTQPFAEASFNKDEAAASLSLKRDSRALGTNAEKLTLKRRRVVETALPDRSQEGLPARDTREMVRTNRHKFMGPIVTDEVDDTHRQNAQSLRFPTLQQSSSEADADANTMHKSHKFSTPSLPENKPSIQSVAENLPSTIENPDKHNFLTRPSLFDGFKSTYPKYDASQRSFVRALVYLEWLISEKRAPHPVLWDDFIRAFSAEYQDHIVQSLAMEQAPMTGVEFYNNEVTNPLFFKRFITMENLQEALSLDTDEVENCRRRFRKTEHRQMQSQGPLPSERRSVGVLQTRGSQMCLPSVENTDLEVESISQGLRISFEKSSANPLGHHISRKPFFETASQIETAKRAQKSRGSVESPDLTVVQSDHPTQATKAPRNLPWLKIGTSSASTASPNRNSLNEIRPMSAAKVRGSFLVSPAKEDDFVLKKTFRRSLGSPILGGRISEPLATSDIGERSTASSPRRLKDVFKQPKLPASKTRTASLGQPRSGDPGKVEGWLNDQSRPPTVTSSESPGSSFRKRQSFDQFLKAYVPRRKRENGSSSNKSTPNLTPAASFRANPARVSSMERAEPETQEWKF